MQRLSSCVFQKVQQQGARQVEEGRGRAGPQEGESRRTTAGPSSSQSQFSEAAISFSSKDRKSSESPPSPLLRSTIEPVSLTFNPLREEPSSILRQRGDDSLPQTPATAATRLRSSHGSRETAQAWWLPAPTEASPQLVGRSTWSNANFIVADQTRPRRLSDSIVPAATSRTCHRSSTDDTTFDTTLAESGSITPPGTPSTTGSTKSRTSTLAYVARDRRTDLRLLKVDSRPSERVSNRSSILHSSGPSQSTKSSRTSPKIVEDSRDYLKATEFKPPKREHELMDAAIYPSVDTTKDMSLFRAESTKSTKSSKKDSPSRPPRWPLTKAVRRSHHSSSSGSESAPHVPSNSSSPALTPLNIRPQIQRSPTSHDISRLHESRETMFTPSVSPGSIVQQSHGIASSIPPNRAKPTTISVTPPSDMQSNSSFRPDEHYFQALGTASQSSFTPTLMPTDPRQRVAVSELRATPVQRPSELPVEPATPPPTRKRKWSSILGPLIRRSRSQHLPDTTHRSSSESPQQRSNQDVLVEVPYDQEGKRKVAMSPGPASPSSYFASSRLYARRMGTALPALSPMAIILDEEPSYLNVPRRSYMVSSMPGTPRSPLPPVPASPLSSRRVSIELPGRQGTHFPGETPTPSPPWSPALPSPLYLTSSQRRERVHATYTGRNGQEFDKVALTGQGAPSWLPSEMRRVDTPPLPVDHHTLEQRSSIPKSSGFSSFFFDFRSMPHDSHSAHSREKSAGKLDESPMAATTARRPALRPRVSAPVLPSQSPTSILKSQPSTEPLTGPSPNLTVADTPELDVRVTGFSQTSYMQRYHDSARANRNHLRSIIDRQLIDEGDELMTESRSSVGTTFELDVPDHLPNSPLCPLDSRHKSGGKSICPLHGRQRPSGAGKGKAADRTN